MKYELGWIVMFECWTSDMEDLGAQVVGVCTTELRAQQVLEEHKNNCRLMTQPYDHYIYEAPVDVCLY